MTTQILNIAFGETPVSFRADGFLNATAIAKHFGKLPKDYLKTEQTQEYIVALAEAMTERTKILTVENQLVIIKKGGNNKDEQGTWLHPKLAIHFARWLDPKFAVWCDFQIEKILGINQEQATDRLTDEQVGYLYNQVMRICGETGQAYQTVFGGLKRHFQVASYKHIKASDFAQACKWLGVPLPMEKVLYGEVLEKEQPTKPTIQLKNHDYGMARFFVNYGAGCASIVDLHCALNQLSEIHTAFMKMVEYRTLHRGISKSERYCIDILTSWHSALAEAGCQVR